MRSVVAVVLALHLCLLAASRSVAQDGGPPTGVPLWQSLSDPWQQRLLSELRRPVSLTVADADALAVLRAVSLQCRVAMSFASADAPLPKLTLDVHGIPLQALLDRIGASAALRYGIGSGAVRWERADGHEQPAGQPEPWTISDAPMETRWYLLERASGIRSGGIGFLIDAIQKQPGWTGSEPARIIQLSGSIVVTQPLAGHAAIEQLVRAICPDPPVRRGPPSDTAGRAAHLLVDDLDHPPPGAAERRLRDDLRHRREFDLAAPTIGDFVARFTALTGIRVVAADAGDLGRPLPARAIPTRRVMLEPRHALQLALAGSGLVAAMRASGSSAWMELAAEKTPPQMVTRIYRCDWSEMDPTMLVDMVRRVDRMAWGMDGAGIEETTDTLLLDDGSTQELNCLHLTCSRETHAEIEERMAVYAAVDADTDAPPARPDVPPAIVITVP